MDMSDALMRQRPDRMAEEEWRLRLELAACYRIVDYMGWSELIYNHITMRVPGPQRHYLINPFGLNYDEVTASNLIKVGLDGKAVDPSPHPVNAAGFIIHGAIHGAREDAHCIIHTHTTAGIAVAMKEGGLKHDDFYGAMLFGRVAYHDFEGISVRADEQPRLVKSLGDKAVLILRNHGLLVCEHDIPSAFRLMWHVQRSCEIQCAADAISGPNRILSDDVRRQSSHDAANFEPRGKLERMVMASVLRRAGLTLDMLA